MNVKHIIYARRRPRRRSFRWSNVFSLLLFAVLALMLFLVLDAGTTLYQHVNSDRNQANQTRIGTSLLLNTVRAVDETGAVSQADGPEGPALVLTEHLDSGNYETRIYLHDGWIVKEYTLASAPLDPDSSTRLTQSSTFSFEMVGADALRIHTDEGETVIALRSDDAIADARQGDSTTGGASTNSSNVAGTASGAAAGTVVNSTSGAASGVANGASTTAKPAGAADATSAGDAHA